MNSASNNGNKAIVPQMHNFATPREAISKENNDSVVTTNSSLTIRAEDLVLQTISPSAYINTLLLDIDEDKENQVHSHSQKSMGSSSQKGQTPNCNDFLLSASFCPPKSVNSYEFTIPDDLPTLSSLSQFPSQSYGKNNLIQHPSINQFAPTNVWSTNANQVQNSFQVRYNDYCKILEQVKHNAKVEFTTPTTSCIIDDRNVAASALLDLSPTTTAHDNLVNNNILPSQQVIGNCDTRSKGQTSNSAEQSLHQQNTKASPRVTSFCVSDDATENYFFKPMIHKRMCIEHRAHELLNDAPYTTVACNCTKSHCLKLYCGCFHSGKLCDAFICACNGCKNTSTHSLPRASRARAVYEILNRRIDAFDLRQRKIPGLGCNCKKSKCLQKYCACFANENVCTAKCSCDNCCNIEGGRKIDNIKTTHNM